MFSDVENEKYIVFKLEEFKEFLLKAHTLIDCGWAHDGGDLEKWVDHIMVSDAVVIRRQDVFAPPALDTYANSILATVEALKTSASPDTGLICRLTGISDYFHDQATTAWDEVRKLPD